MNFSLLHAAVVLLTTKSLDMSSYSIAVPVLAATLWLFWWIWRFKLRPYLHPQEPRELSYFIPYLGHAISFFSNSVHLVTRARLTLGDTREPFSITLAGTSMYILTHPKDVAEAYRNMTTFSYDIFVQEMMSWCGSSKSCIRDMYLPRPDTAFPNPKRKPLAVLARDMHIHQLFPGQNLEYLCDKFQDYFTSTLRFDSISTAWPKQPQTDAEILLPLSTWVSDSFVRAGTRAYFGEELFRVDADLVDVFVQFDELSWQILYQYPRCMSGNMYAARDRLTASIERYLELPQEKRSGDAWFTKAMENEMRRAGLSLHDIATMMMTIHWGINTNTRRACFWMLSYMLDDPTLLEEIRAETIKACMPGGTLDRQLLFEKCPRLEAAWNETLRLTASAVTVRYVAQDTVIGGKLLRKGNRIMIPNRQLHLNGSVFGADPSRFDSDRFYHNDKLLRSPSWRPFGGGTTMCPGRFIAKQAAFMFTAMLLIRFEVSKADGKQAFPTLDTKTPVLGVMTFTPGTEFVVRLRPKSQLQMGG